MSTILRRVKRFVQKIAIGGAVSAELEALTGQVVPGILESKSVHLSKIGRTLDEDEELIITEKRLSRGMANKRYDDDSLRRGYWKIASRAYERCPFVIGDIAVQSKPYGEAFEYLDVVRDASSKDKHLEPGYWSLQLEATTRDHKNIPIDLQIFSTRAPDYEGWFETIEKTFLRAMPVIPRSATFLLDRGFDDVKVMWFLNAQRRVWVIRQKQDRNVVVADRTWNMAELAEGLRCYHKTWVPYVNKKTHKEWEWPVTFNFIPVELPGLKGTYTLVVIDGMRKERMVLLSNRRLRDPKAVAGLIRAALRRWAIEEGIRLLKQKAALEDFRVRSWTSIQRIALMAMLAYGFLALMVHDAPKAAQRAIDRIKVFIPHVLFPYYRLWDGVAEELAAS